MIQQLVQRWAAQLGGNVQQAAGDVLTADPLDLVLHMEQVWDAANLWLPNPGPAGPARAAAIATNRFNAAAPPVNAVGNPAAPAWFHLAYALAIENTRAPQIIARAIRAFRSGESLGIPSYATQRWLDVTETVLLGAANPFAAWLSTSHVRMDPEAVRRNAYFRLFGMDVAHGTDTNSPFPYEKPDNANRGFVQVFEELLYELWKAIENVRNIAGANAADDDRIFRLSEQIGYMLRTRRQNALLGREELAAVTAMGWIDLTLSADTPVVRDLRASAASAGDRLRLIGERVGLAAHSKAASFLAMGEELSVFMRALEAGWVTGANLAWLFYRQAPAPAIGDQVRRVITEWAAASGKNLKAMARPAQVSPGDGRILVRT